MKIEMTETSLRQTYFKRLVGWLRSREDRKRIAAATIFRRFGRLSVDLLVREATGPGKQRDHRITLLDLVVQIGAPLGIDELDRLQTLRRHRDPKIRATAEKVIMAQSPCGVPDNPAVADLMRAFNPFLASPPRCPSRSPRISDFKAALHGGLDALRRRARSSAALRRREEQG